MGITGRAEFVDLDGPIVVLRLSGRFWHARSRVLERLQSYIIERIPEAVAVEIEDASQLEVRRPILSLWEPCCKPGARMPPLGTVMATRSCGGS